MKHTIEFDPTEERLELMQAVLAHHAWFAIGEILEKIRNKLKYDENIGEPEKTFLEEIRESIGERMSLLDACL